MEAVRAEFEMCYETDRLKTFKNWSFQRNGKCVPLEMARAGFYCPDANCPDLAKCFVCNKELDGWEINDIPWDEHKAHAPDCPFVKLGKTENEVTVDDFLTLACERSIYLIKKGFDEKVAEVKQRAAEVRKKMGNL